MAHAKRTRPSDARAEKKLWCLRQQIWSPAAADTKFTPVSQTIVLTIRTSKSKRLRLHFAYAACPIVSDPTHKTQSHLNQNTHTHTHAHTVTRPPPSFCSRSGQTRPKNTRDEKTDTSTTLTLTQCWQVNGALQKTVITYLFLPSSLNQTQHPFPCSNLPAMNPKVSRLGLTLSFFLFRP